jgi:hypothetical protein
VPIGPDDDALAVSRRVSEAAVAVLARSWPRLKAGTAPRIPLDLTKGSYFGARKPEDGLIDWFRPTGRPIHILLSKADKLSRQEQTKVLRSVQAEIATWGDAELYSVQLFSSLKKTGVEEAERVLAGWLGIELKTRENKKAPG